MPQTRMLQFRSRNVCLVTFEKLAVEEVVAVSVDQFPPVPAIGDAVDQLDVQFYVAVR